ncbi:MAG: DNA-processing protein DprA [Clostridia bacterium]|nr:DNA-processing protein DprA [Clostridia bacterium]
MRVAIIGSRNIEYDKMKERAYALLCRYIPANATEIVSGGAVGIDTLAEIYAKQNGLPTKIFKPDYARYGKRAPLVRNDEIVSYAQYVLAVWDGSSHGTAYTVATCIQKGIPVKVVSIEDTEKEDDD